MKKYLKTPEEVIDALHEGKTVISNSDERYELYKGLVIGKFKGNFIINSSICDQDKPYIEEPEPLKIEVGKFYKTRSGKKARCFYNNGQRAYFTIDGRYEIFWVCPKTGDFFEHGAESSYDIIGPWGD